MKSLLPMKRCTWIMALAAVFSAHAQQQGGSSVPGAWIPMHEAVFDWPELPTTATAEERSILQALWAKELAARHKTPTGQLPGFALIGDVREGAKRIVFTMLSAGGVDSCDPAANGAAASDIYEVCRLRVTGWPQARQPVDLPGYCMIAGPRDSNSRIEYRYDKPAQSVQFRTIQFGQPVPNCSRTLKLG